MSVQFNTDSEFYLWLGEMFEEHMGIPATLVGSQARDFSFIFNKGEKVIDELKDEWAGIDPNKLIGFEGVDLSNKEWFGIDMPVWLTKGDTSKRRIMIIAMDPLRKKSATVNPNTISLNTPFTLHDKRVSNNYNKHIHQLAIDNEVYVTDAFKLFYRDATKYDTLSNSDDKFKDLSIHEEMLMEEIRRFNPDFILCMGDKAIKAIARVGRFKKKSITATHLSYQRDNYSFKNIPVFAIPHPSSAAQGGQKSFMKLHGVNHPDVLKNYLSEAIKLVERYF